MDISLFDYELPESNIAQYPSVKRDASRLMVLDRGTGLQMDRQFSDLPEYLRPGDLLVMNDSRVIRARLIGHKASTGARIELFLLKPIATNVAGRENGWGALVKPAEQENLWETLAKPAKRLKVGDEVYFGSVPGISPEPKQVDNDREGGKMNFGSAPGVSPEPKQTDNDHEGGKMNFGSAPGISPEPKQVDNDHEGGKAGFRPAPVISGSCPLSCKILEKRDDGSVLVVFKCQGVLSEAIERLGNVPLPPYIRRAPEAIDAERYQTVYAQSPGSAAAPTAGLHFTEPLLERIRTMGVETAFVTLHVGLGTFRPVTADRVEDHRMHEEHFYISKETAVVINQAKDDGRRIICVGTTAVRTLESASCWDHEGNRHVKPGWGSTDIFIYPGGRKFFMTDALITNFHLPKSTLLMLVSAFYEREEVLAAYRDAVAKGYRFFSYGDAMLIL